jgi:hypothetical protein
MQQKLSLQVTKQLKVESNQLSSCIMLYLKSVGDQNKHLKYHEVYYKKKKKNQSNYNHHCPGRKLQGDQELNDKGTTITS